MDPANQGPPNKKLKINDKQCVKCKFYFRKGAKVGKIIQTREESKAFNQNYNFLILPDEIICEKCFVILRKAKSQACHNRNLEVTIQVQSDDIELSQSLSKVSMDDKLSISDKQSSQQTNQSSYHPTDESEYKEIEFITMPFNRVVFSKAYCFICGQRNKIIDVPLEARLQVFSRIRLFIAKRNRCCPGHLIKYRFYENQIPKMTIYSSETTVESTELKSFIEKLSEKIDITLHDKISSFSISEERVQAFTGHSWNTILMLQDLTSLRNSSNRNVIQSLVIFLFKLRSGSSNALIAAVLEVPEKIVETSIKSVLNTFRKDVLPKNFGVSAHTREFYLQQQTKAIELLYGLNDTLFIICDGTYIRHEKSANNVYQTKSYSGQKKVPLCKPFTICTTNGFIVDTVGSFEGTLNDAEILKRVLQDPNGLISILKPGDVFIIDRGFRDILTFLKEKGFKVMMPALKGNKKQLTTEESNESRFVTKLRWVVEAIHGIIAQKYKLLHHQFRNQALPDVEVYCKTACFLQNLAGKRLNSEGEKLEIIIERMKTQKNVTNYLAERVLSNNYDQKTVPFKKITSNDVLEFPELTLDDLELMFTGIYQLKQAISYLGEMLNDDNTLAVSYLKEDQDVIRFEVKSRHISRRTYKCYIHYNANSEGIDAIQGYCCNCANGLRTIGCCSHVAALLYHLSYGRYLSDVIRPAEILTNLFKVDNICPVIDVDSEED